MNEYQACLYLSESFFHCGSKYGHVIPQFCYIFYLSSALACRVESINDNDFNKEILESYRFVKELGGSLWYKYADINEITDVLYTIIK